MTGPAWTEFRPVVTGFYWWRRHQGRPPRVVELIYYPGRGWYWLDRGIEVRDGDYPLGLWWPHPIRMPPEPDE